MPDRKRLLDELARLKRAEEALLQPPTPDADPLRVSQLKRRKLKLRDEIARIELASYPEIAGEGLYSAHGTLAREQPVAGLIQRSTIREAVRRVVERGST